MSIFKETFKDFVFRQLRMREAIIEQGNDPTKFKHRFGNPRTKIEGENGESTNVNIAAGAFYTNTVHKQCVIRMTSGVDVTSREFLEEEEDGEGDKLAKAYILEGGVLDENKKPRSGFAKNNGAYGDKSIRSNAADGFGIVPMPGIIDADIRTKTAYGSLREAKVNFVCHNRRQLEVLELLYMRPGFPILLEWQWSPFINNKGKIDNELYGIGDDWFDPSKTTNDFNTSIIKNKEESNGNYDGFVGFCKNFEFKSRPDGGYDCTTEIIAAGEVLESLKSRNDGYSKKEEDKKIQIDNMQFLLEGIIEISQVKNQLNTGNGSSALDYLKRNELANEFLVNSEGVDALEKLKELKESNSILNSRNPSARNRNIQARAQGYVNTKAADTLRDYFDKVDKYFIFKGDVLGTRKLFFNILTKTNKTDRTYIRWDHLCDLINRIVFPLPNPSKMDDPLCQLVYTQKTNKGKEEYIQSVPYEFPGELYSKVDNNGGKIRNISKDAFKTKLETIIDVESILNNSFDPSICLLPSQISETESGIKNEIGHIMLGVEHLRKVYNQMAYSNDEPKENFNFFDYLKKIWQDVNKACVGNHNFILQTELESPNKARIIDLQVNPPSIKPEDLFEFKIQSNKSIVRDFNFNTTIPSALSATIGIAAQAPTSVSDLDQVTFANFSKGIKSRFTSDTNVIPTKVKKDNSEEIINAYKKDLERYKKNIVDLAVYQAELALGEFDDNSKDTIDDKTFSEATGLASGIQKQITSLLQRNPKTGKRRPIIPSRKSAVIPLKFNVSMGGVSGIVIGHVFKVEKEKLPKGYQADDVAFVVMGESQKITSGQDWTTELSGQLMLLDLGKEEREKLNKKYEGDGGDGAGGGDKAGSEETTSPVILEDEIIDNGPQVDDVILPVNENINPYDPSDVYNWEEWEKNNNPSTQLNNCPPGQVWNEDIQACVLEDVSIEPKIGNTGLTQEQIDNGGLETTKRRVNGNTPYEYAYLLQAAGSAQNGALQEEFFKGNTSNVNILSSKCDKLRQQYSSVFQYNFSMQDFPSLTNANVGSAFSSYESWMAYLSKTFPNLV